MLKYVVLTIYQQLQKRVSPVALRTHLYHVRVDIPVFIGSMSRAASDKIKRQVQNFIREGQWGWGMSLAK